MKGAILPDRFDVIKVIDGLTGSDTPKHAHHIKAHLSELNTGQFPIKHVCVTINKCQDKAACFNVDFSRVGVSKCGIKQPQPAGLTAANSIFDVGPEPEGFRFSAAVLKLVNDSQCY